MIRRPGWSPPEIKILDAPEARATTPCIRIQSEKTQFRSRLRVPTKLVLVSCCIATKLGLNFRRSCTGTANGNAMAWNNECYCHEPVTQCEILNTSGLNSEWRCQERLVRQQVWLPATTVDAGTISSWLHMHIAEKWTHWFSELAEFTALCFHHSSQKHNLSVCMRWRSNKLTTTTTMNR